MNTFLSVDLNEAKACNLSWLYSMAPVPIYVNHGLAVLNGFMFTCSTLPLRTQILSFSDHWSGLEINWGPWKPLFA